MNNKRQDLIWYLAIAFAITWSSVLGIYLLGGAPTSAVNVTSAGPLVGLLMMLATFGPAIAAFVSIKWITREGFTDAGLRFNFRNGWAYYLWAVLAPIAACVMAIALAGAFGMEVSLGALSLENLIAWIVGTLVWTPILFGEEFGWRGYLQHRLVPGRPLLAALLMGLIWGIWHYAQVLAGIVLSANPLALLIYPISCAVTSVFLGWLRAKSMSVWPACLAHAVGNVVLSGAVAKLLPDVAEMQTWVFRIIGFTVVGLVLVLSRRVPWRDASIESVQAQA